ncbi:hypothetical protein ACFL1E_02690 [Candidatus Omnitrophota bacterium]
MQQKVRRILLSLFVLTIVVLAGISFVRYYYLLKQNYNLNTKLLDVEHRIRELNTIKNELEGSLKQEKAEYKTVLEDKEEMKIALEKEIGGLRDTLGQKEQELESTKQELAKVQDNVMALNSDYSNLQGKYDDLQDKIKELKDERDAFEAKFNSLPELKKALQSIHNRVFAKRVELQQKRDAQELREGNKGYLTWQGKSTVKEKVIIEVLPFEP